MIDSENLVESYSAWLKHRTIAKDISGTVEITTPFLDHNNDRLQIYVERRGDLLRLSDDGHVIQGLSMSGCDIQTPKRKEILASIVNGFGVQQNGDVLAVESTIDEFPYKKHRLLQAMRSVDDMFMTSRSTVASLFLEDVEAFLEAHAIRFTPNVQFIGRSGFINKFDFVIPASRTAPERLVSATNRPTRESTASLLFAWNDTRAVRSDKSVLYAALNDTDRPVPSDLLGALTSYGIKPITWSLRENYVSELAA